MKTVKDMGGSCVTGNNPWSGGPPGAMQKGKVKFFNETKGFGMVAGDGIKSHELPGHVILIK
jgi:hypothetical protein